MNKSGNIFSSSAEATISWGSEFAREINPGDSVFLIGDLGSGKTTIARGIARGLGWTGVVNSPSFSLVKVYRCEVTIYHSDLYRLNPGDNLTDLGLQEQMDEENSVSIFEWSEDFPIFGYTPRWEVRISIAEDSDLRKIEWKKTD